MSERIKNKALALGHERGVETREIHYDVTGPLGHLTWKVSLVYSPEILQQLTVTLLRDGRIMYGWGAATLPITTFTEFEVICRTLHAPAQSRATESNVVHLVPRPEPGPEVA